MEVLNVIYFVTLIIAIIVACFKPLQNQRFFLLYLILALGVDSIANFNNQLGLNQYIGFNIFAWVSITYFLYYFNTQLPSNKKVHLIFGGFFSIISTGIIITYPIKKFNMSLFFCFVIHQIVTVLYWFIQQIKNPTEDKLWQKMPFWVGTATLLWSSFFMFRCLPMFYLEKVDVSFLNILQIVHNCINILCNVLYLLGLICIPQRGYLSKLS